MKKLLPLLLFSVVLVSLCSDFPIQLPNLPLSNLPSQTQGVATIDSGSPDLFVNVQTLSSEIKSGRSLQVFFEMRNKQNYDLDSVDLEVYDHPCFEEGNNFIKNDCGHSGTLKANQSCAWSWRWNSTEGSSDDRTCSIKFRVNYEAGNSIFQDIAVLSQSEYDQREADGTLQNVPIQSTYAKGPLQVSLTFSEPQPFISNQEGYNMFINYNNVGDGLFADEEKDIDLSLTVPDNMENLNCDHYSGSDKLRLDSSSLKFIKGRSVPTICTFSTPEIPTMSIRSMKIEIGYKYTLYDSFPITVTSS